MKLVEFTRFNPHNSKIEEKVWVVVEKVIHPNDKLKFEKEAYKQLFKQYPIWECPYGKINTPFKNARHSWSSPSMGIHWII